MKVSIVITAYNKERTLRKAVESAVGQTWGDVEVIVVEDKSTDGTRGVLFSLAEEYPNVTVLLCGKNVGAGLARRRGISYATGDYVMLLDADDWIEPNYISDMAERAIAEDADIVTAGISIHTKDGKVCEVGYGSGTVMGDAKISGYFGQTIMFLNNRLVRRSLYDKVPYSHRRYIEDVQTCVMLLWWANKNCFVENYGYHYEYNPESLTRTADDLKTHLFKTLCVTDLVKFFAEHDRRYLEVKNEDGENPLEGAYRCGLEHLAKCDITDETIAPYRKEWEELRAFAES